MTEDDFSGFIKAYTADDRRKVDDPRFSVYTREEIAEKSNTLDLGLIKEDTLKELSLSEIVEQSEELLSEFKETMQSLEAIVSELKELQSND